MINSIIVSAVEEIYFKTKKCENLKNMKSIRRNEFYHSLPDKVSHPLSSGFTIKLSGSKNGLLKNRERSCLKRERWWYVI